MGNTEPETAATAWQVIQRLYAQRSVNVSGQGKIIGPSAGVNTGTMGGTFHVSGDDGGRDGQR